ncbi:CARDB domain-containing protein [Methanothermococcus okinawensis]|uniref:APHP domain protein n=1 Tax=Methanothermococcus okinawensis (strain DSM 14208 / JCM 11175 / IH1) TaxID=647113 RepID=F8AL38_METOI|nr:CARDB domain-containing protein [Methanothermococcus okinawensis]AEH06474.1 APHP domain protein [Methanothermococcus okinawensis IH1]
MNIIKPILLAIIVLLTGMASTSGMATVELPNVALHPGECTNITVTVKNVNDLAGGRVVLSYNASVIKIEKLNFLINGLNPTPNLNYERNGTVICSFAGSTGVSGNISLMNVSIRAIGVGNTSTPIYLNKTVHINNRDFYTYLKNSASNNINFSMKNGIITIIQPDLTVTNLQVPTNPIVNNTYAINATIKNIGTDNASSFNVVLKDNGNNVATKTVNSLNAKSTTTISFNWKPSTEGAHNLTVVVDSSKQVNETNELNNQLSKMVYVKPIPIHDVAVESVNANNTVVNTTINVTATISNKGNQNETNINVSLYANNQYQSSSFLNLDAGKNKTITFTYIPTTVGTVALKVKAVIKNDNNPSNNEKETTITVSAKPKPDLIPQNISLKSTEGLNEYVENHTYNITALVINTGTNDSGAFNVSLKIDGNTINKTTINSLTKGSSKLVSFLWTPNTTGAHTIEIVADSGNNIDELSENNNKISKQITVNPENTNFSATPKK